MLTSPTRDRATSPPERGEGARQWSWLPWSMGGTVVATVDGGAVVGLPGIVGARLVGRDRPWLMLTAAGSAAMGRSTSNRSIRLARRRPRSEGLTIERIIDEALALVDEEGLDALTVRRLATRLDTGSATLYRHVASRTELLVLM